jgi:hypothetical protein
MVGHCASPQASDAIPNRARPTASTCRRPSRSARRPPASSSDPNASAYPVTIHCNSAAGMPSSRWIDGSATFTTLKSSCSTNWAAQISEMTNMARREPPAAGSGAAPFVEWSAIGESPVLTVFLTGSSASTTPVRTPMPVRRQRAQMHCICLTDDTVQICCNSGLEAVADGTQTATSLPGVDRGTQHHPRRQARAHRAVRPVELDPGPSNANSARPSTSAEPGPSGSPRPARLWWARLAGP